MDKDSKLIATKLQHYELGPGDMIALIGSNCYEYDAVIIGAYRLNVANVRIHHDTDHSKLHKIVTETKSKELSLTEQE